MVADVVQTDVVTAERDTPIATVVAEMAEYDVGSVVVVEDDRPVGIITDRSIALSLETAPDIADRAVEEVMAESPVTVTQDEDVFDTIRVMEESAVRRIPVVDDDGRLQGIVSLDDILVLLGSELDNAAEIIKAQTPRF